MGCTMLLADDSVTTHRVMELTFAGENIRVVSVADGEQALERMRTSRPDILVAEVALPRIDGYKLAEHVRSTPVLSGLPVLLLTGAFDVVDESRVHACGAAGIIVKPFEPEFVIKRVKELLGISAREQHPAGMRLVTPAEPPSPERIAAQQGGGPVAVTAERSGAAAAVAAFPPAAPSAPSSSDKVSQQPGVEGAPEMATKAAQASGASNDYLGQLDAAFSQLDQQMSATARGPEPPSPSAVASMPARVPSPAEAPILEIDQEWFDGNLAARPGASRSVATPLVPDVADTFQALLAAEQGEAPVLVTPEPIGFSDEVIERIATRVAERLSQGVLVETVRSVVETVAERLVREEIARIRSKVETKKS